VSSCEIAELRFLMYYRVCMKLGFRLSGKIGKQIFDFFRGEKNYQFIKKCEKKPFFSHFNCYNSFLKNREEFDLLSRFKKHRKMEWDNLDA
jgi:hypothetical protein